MFLKIIKTSHHDILIDNFHHYSRLRIELDLLDKELGTQFPYVKDITNHLRMNNRSRDIDQLRLKLQEYAYDVYRTIETRDIDRP